MAETITTIDDTLRQTVETRVLTLWRDGDGTLRCAVQLPSVNGLIDPTEAILDKPPAGQPWMKVEIGRGENEIATIGADRSGLNRAPGKILLGIRVPAGLGLKPLNDLVGPAKQLFSRFVGNGLYCQASGLEATYNDAGWICGQVGTRFVLFESIV